MNRAVRYLAVTYLKNLFLSAGIIGLLGTLGTHVAHIELFSMWYAILPMFFVIFAFVYGFTLVTLYRHIALSFHCRRKDFFLGCQAVFVAGALGSALLLWAFGRLPVLLPGGYAPYEFGGSVFYGMPFWADKTVILVMSGLLLLLQPVGAALGGLMERRKVLGIIVYILILMLAVAATTLSLFALDGSFTLPREIVLGGGAGLAALAILCEIYFYCSNRKAVVR